MDDFKIRNFLQSHPGISPPRHERLSTTEAAELRNRIRLRANALKQTADVELTRELAEEATPVRDADPSAPGFDLLTLLRALGIRAKASVYINWYRYDVVDRIALIDLSRFFSDIWYPGADDIEIFDDTCCWLLVVPHSGVVRVAVLQA